MKNIPGTKGRYMVTEEGRVLSVRHGELFELEKCGPHRKFVNIYIEGVMNKALVSYLVARAFLPNPEGRPFVVHKDGDPGNNTLENLAWSETKEYRARHTGVVRRDRDGGDMKAFTSVAEAARMSGVSRTAIMNCLKGISETAGGYRWMRMD